MPRERLNQTVSNKLKKGKHLAPPKLGTTVGHGLD